MTTITITKDIDAPVEQVFTTVADIQQFSTAIPHIKSVEFLTDRRSGVGTRFRETRVIRNREASTTLEVTEYVTNERIRLVSDSHGTVWDSVFTTEPRGEGTRLELVMEARPHSIVAKLTTPLIHGVVKKEIEKDLDLVKAHCERTPVA